MAKYEIGNRSVYHLLDEVCNDTNLYPYVKQHKPMRDRRGVFHAIHLWWLGSNHVNAVESEAE